ncbi:MAG: aminotransferase class V-fold PLP-dependent enzyme [Oscillospiraceae bacterium]|nr:aminotransferase class V-fold PLP-dependent enzyme [Oscillospiraceae bacterium]
MIYLDNAATTLKKPQCVIDAVCAAMGSMGNASRGAHGGSLHASRMVYETREKLARLFGCKRADHVVFTSNSTESLNIAIRGAISAGSHVISTDLEHNSVLRPLHLMAAEQGVKLSFVPADRRGCVKISDFEQLIQEDTSAIVCTHASNLTGNVIDLAAVGEIAKRHNLLFIVDASQSAGAMEIDMEKMGIDILCFTGHKGLMAPQGVGGLCVREGVEVRPLKVGGSGIQSYSMEHPTEMPTRLEAGTLNSHGIAGLYAALDYLFEVGVEEIEKKERALMRRFYDGVVNVPGVTVYGDFETEKRGAVVTLNIGDYDSGVVSDELSEVYDIATRAGAHCAPRMHQALGTVEQGAVRFSFSWFTTEEEVDAAIHAVREMAES